jgi:hypothetical protein
MNLSLFAVDILSVSRTRVSFQSAGVPYRDSKWRVKVVEEGEL